MKKTLRVSYIVLAVALFLSAILLGQEARADNKKHEEWSYKLILHNKGTRSEGWTGFLAKNGKAIDGIKEGAIIETPIGRFKWFGKQTEKDTPFRNRGWLNKLPRGREVFENRGKK